MNNLEMDYTIEHQDDLVDVNIIYHHFDEESDSEFSEGNPEYIEIQSIIDDSGNDIFRDDEIADDIIIGIIEKVLVYHNDICDNDKLESELGYYEYNRNS